MLHVDKLQHLDLIPFSLQIFRAEPVRGQSGKPLPQKPVIHDRRQGSGASVPGRELRVQLVLAARHREDHFRAPSHRFCQRVIRSCIAGMESDHHIYPVHAVIVRDIPHEKGQLVIPVLFRQFPAVVDHVFFQVQPDDADVISSQLVEIVIHSECEIRFPASEIQYRKLPSLLQPGKDILDKFQEAVDLSEFVRLRPHDLPVLCHHTQVSEERNRCALLQDIILPPVMGAVRRPHLCLPLLPSYCDLPFFAHKYRALFPHGLDLHLPEPLHNPRDLPARIFSCQILMKCLCLCEGFKLKVQLPLFFKRAHPDLYYALPVPRITYSPADKIYIQDFRQKP